MVVLAGIPCEKDHRFFTRSLFPATLFERGASAKEGEGGRPAKFASKDTCGIVLANLGVLDYSKGQGLVGQILLVLQVAHEHEGDGQHQPGAPVEPWGVGQQRKDKRGSGSGEAGSCYCTTQNGKNKQRARKGMPGLTINQRRRRRRRDFGLFPFEAIIRDALTDKNPPGPQKSLSPPRDRSIDHWRGTRGRSFDDCYGVHTSMFIFVSIFSPYCPVLPPPRTTMEPYTLRACAASA